MSRRGWVLFAAMCVIWGVPYLMIKVAVEELEPATLVLGRCVVATVLLLPVAVAKGQLRALLPRWRPLLTFAAVEICVPWLLLNTAEQRLSSSLTGLLIAAVPLVGALIVRVTGTREQLGWRRALGLGIGMAGVAALVGFEVGTSDIGAVAAVAVVAVCYAVGPVIIARHLADAPGLGVMAASLGVSTVVYLVPGIAQAPSHVPSGKVVLSVLGLGVVCTALAFLVFFALIAEVGAARSTVITYVNPAVAVLLGVAVLGEDLTVTIAVGFVLILLGSVLATSRSPQHPEPVTTVDVPGEVPAAGTPPQPARRA